MGLAVSLDPNPWGRVTPRTYCSASMIGSGQRLDSRRSWLHGRPMLVSHPGFNGPDMEFN